MQRTLINRGKWGYIKNSNILMKNNPEWELSKFYKLYWAHTHIHTYTYIHWRELITQRVEILIFITIYVTPIMIQIFKLGAITMISTSYLINLDFTVISRNHSNWYYHIWRHLVIIFKETWRCRKWITVAV